MKRRGSLFQFQLALVLVAALLSSVTVHAEGVPTSVTLTPASAREMIVQLSDGQLVSQFLPVYPLGQRWYLPFGEITRGIGVEIEVVPETALAQGFIKTENRTFKLDARECKIEREGKTESYDCHEAVVQDDDIYVTVELLQKLLPLDIDVNSFRSEVTLTAKEPFIAAPGVGRTRTGPFDPGYPKVAVPAKKLDGFMVDSQLGYANEHVGDSSLSEGRHDTLFSAEVLGMEANAFVSGRADRIQQQRYTLSKHDAEGSLPLGLREISLLDVNFPTLPMIGASGTFRGAMVSSYPLLSPSQFGSQDFIGDLQAGWEVELYQNDVLIDRRPSRSGRYEFKAVPLTYGVNRFRLAFYGPQGQRRERYETYSIDSSFLKPGEQSYRLGVANDLGAQSRWLMQYDRSIAKNFNIYSAATRFSSVDVVNLTTYGLLGARTYIDKLLLTTQAAASEGGGTAWDSTLQAPFQQATFGFGYTHLSNFFSDIYKLERGHTPRDVMKGNVAFDLFAPFTVRFTFEGSKTVYQDEQFNNFLIARQSTRTGPVAWFHTLTYDEFGAGVTGELSTQTTVNTNELRTTVGYDPLGVATANVEVQKRITDFTTVGFGWLETFRLNLRKQSALLTRQFPWFTLTANASVENQGNFAVGALVSYAFGRDSRDGDWWVQAKPQALLGAVSVLAFLDTNQNGVRDPGEPALEGAEIVVNQQESGIRTGKTGIGVVTGLTVQEPADISLSSSTLGGPQRRPSPRGVRIYPRAGKTAQIDFPIVVLSEVAGFIQVKTGFAQRPKRNVRVILRDAETRREIKSAFSDADGFYLIDEIRAGAYVVELDPLQLRGLKLQSESMFYKLSIGAEGVVDNTKDFVLETGVSK